jgi:hypothetical protein
MAFARANLLRVKQIVQFFQNTAGASIFATHAQATSAETAEITVSARNLFASLNHVWYSI